ncbi:transcriptional regulator [Methylobacterium terrae]|uniref:Transcriptional regulator n=1 Tax=Methylobacterium terrae TaxID=2202827 RepID=A0A2U8WMU5_9HYPH|nr:helix-turn-helix transcriptional regulator [Methylobacterium terrae]AWN46532.1 transcriptional regulator [Methylobacterium terrae]
MAYHLAHSAGSADIATGAANTDDVATCSSGNVYADLGFEDPTEESLKADLVIGIIDEIERRGLSQTAAARLMGVSQPDVSKLLRGRTGGYSLERLLGFTRALGGDVEITVRRNEPKQRGKLKLRVLEPV